MINNLPQHNSEEWFIDYSNPLGKGSLSDGVYKARKLNSIINGKLIPNDGECVIKIIGTRHLDKIGLKEIEIIDRLFKLDPCDQIIEYYGYGFSGCDGGILYIYMEYLDGFQSLTDIINNRIDKKLDENEIIELRSCMIKGLRFIHNQDIIHRDIKCDNILYNEQTKQAKLIDFGISKYTQNKASTYAGTPTHMAPESRLGNTTSKSDMYSLGCTLIEMAGGDLSNTNIDGIPIVPNHLSRKTINDIHLLITKDLFFRTGSNSNEIWKYGDFYYGERYGHNVDFNNETDIANIPSNVGFINLLNFNYQVHSLSFIPPNITTIQMDQLIPASFIPPSITRIISTSFNEAITPDLVPSTVSRLELISYNQPIQPYSIPPSIVSLNLPSFDQPLEENSITSSITSLSIPSFNHDLEEETLPESIIYLHLGQSFELNSYGGNLPSSIRFFRCDYNFKSPLRKQNNIPKNVSIIRLDNYNQTITSNSIPETASWITLGSNFTHYESLKNLPPSTICLAFFIKDKLDIEIRKKIKMNAPKSISFLFVNNRVIQ